MTIKKITVYSTRTCSYCVMLKSWLQSKNVPFTEYSVDYNRIAAEHMVRLSGQMGVPFTTVEFTDRTVKKVLGFDRQQLEPLLESASFATAPSTPPNGSKPPRTFKSKP